MGEGLAPLSNTRKSQRRSDYVGWGIDTIRRLWGKGSRTTGQKSEKKTPWTQGRLFLFCPRALCQPDVFLISIAQRAAGSWLKLYTKLPRQNRLTQRFDRRGRGIRPTSLPNPLKAQRNSAVRSTPFLTNAILCCLMVRSHDSPFLGSGHVFPNALLFLPAKQAVFVKQVVGQSDSVR